MRRNFIITICFVAVVLTSCVATGNMSSGTIVNLNRFKGEVDEILPQKFSSRNVSFGYSLELRNDSAIVHLPYMGEVYNPVLNDDGLNFAHPLKSMNTTRNKKGTATIASFTVSHGSVNYSFRLEAYDGGSFSLFMQPSNAQSCNYIGHWE